MEKIGLTLDRLFYQTLLRKPDENIVFKQKKESYSKLFTNSVKLANAIFNSEFKNKTIGVIDWNTIEYAEMMYGIPFSGSIIHPVNIKLPVEHMLKTIILANDEAIFFSKDFLPIINKLLSLKPELKNRIFITDTENSYGFNNYHDFLKEGSESFKLYISEDTPSVKLFTSGTTGEPKEVLYTHKKTVLAIWSILTLLSVYEGNSRLRSSDRVFSLIPFYHIFSWGSLYFSTLAGTTYIMDGKFDPQSILDSIEKNKVTWMCMVPTMLYALLAHPDSNIMSHMKILIGGSPIPSGLIKMAKDKEIELTSIYGFTDGLLASIGTVNDKYSNITIDEKYEISVAGSTPAPFSEIKIVSENEKIGEIYFRAPWLPEKYENNIEKSKETYTEDGWFKPGDAGFVDKYGDIHISDRIRDLIKSGGEFISSAILESYISEISGVELAAVVGKEDLKWVERPVAFIKMKEGFQLDPKNIKEHLEAISNTGKISKWWIPDEFINVKEMPLTGTGKIDKKVLREMLKR